MTLEQIATIAESRVQITTPGQTRHGAAQQPLAEFDRSASAVEADEECEEAVPGVLESRTCDDNPSWRKLIGLVLDVLVALA